MANIRKAAMIEEGRRRAIAALNARQNFNVVALKADYTNVRDALGRLPVDATIDRITAFFWLNPESWEEFQRWQATKPPKSPFPPRTKRVATVEETLAWHDYWLDREAEETARHILSRKITPRGPRQPFLAFQGALYGHADALSMEDGDILGLLRKGASIVYVTIDKALDMPWENGDEKAAWENFRASWIRGKAQEKADIRERRLLGK